jgi:hypothetical protein
VNRFSDCRISQKKFLRIFYTDLRILLIQQIVDLACNLVRILDCDFIVELLADSNLEKTIVGSRILLQICADRQICIPLFTPPPLNRMLLNKILLALDLYRILKTDTRALSLTLCIKSPICQNNEDWMAWT